TVALHVVHHIRRRLLRPQRDHRNRPAARGGAGRRPVRLVLAADGEALMTVAAPPAEGVRTGSPWGTVARYFVLCALAAFFLMPVYVLVVTSFKNPSDVSATHIWDLPTSLSLSNFSAVWPKLSSGFRNSLALSIPASLISSLLGCANGCVLSKIRFPHANIVFPLILFGIFVPYQA